MRPNTATCASCASFPREGLDGEGVATCTIFDKPTSYDWPACVLYEQAKDKPQRRELVERLRLVK